MLIHGLRQTSNEALVRSHRPGADAFSFAITRALLVYLFLMVCFRSVRPSPSTLFSDLCS